MSASTHDEMMKSTPENIDFTGFGTGLGNESMPPIDMPGPKPTRKPMPKPDMGCMGGLKDMDMESFRLKMAMGKIKMTLSLSSQKLLNFVLFELPSD